MHKINFYYQPLQNTSVYHHLQINCENHRMYQDNDIYISPSDVKFSDEVVD